MGNMLKLLDRGVCGEEIVPDEEYKFQEGPELDCPVMACALGVFTLPKAEVEPLLDQVGDVPGFGVRGGCCRGHSIMDDARGGWSFPAWLGYLRSHKF